MKHVMIGRIESILARLVTRRLSEFTRDKRGVSAVEFAMLLPLMLTLYLGGVEVSQGISIDRKVTLTARTVADLVAQVASIDTAGINAALGASTAVMAPYPDSSVKVTVSVIDIDANGNAKIKWSATKNGTARAVGSSVTLPAALNVPSTSLVWGEASYTYKPSIGYVVTGTMNLSDQIYMRPRLSDTIQKI
ncbi:TadE/TadG family type IV pilus assembly protein [Pseudorhodoplanes sp.]|uniref:TadE/TadG family type IV pilus assembly protein n=1 Tax=Pseudorhodoplanes sp. TaxID=1934341 RepID=UPI002C1A1C35|nr:TadE/TadG family type IV pilus assembly protein [Pseudorhodoplanes sp.]HWV52146.1 TadE/TadG family type IV pilus assembly protein [Pseudorhodoplanes sp.]